MNYKELETMKKKEVIYELAKIYVEYYNYRQILIAHKNRIRDAIRRKIEGISYDKHDDIN